MSLWEGFWKCNQWALGKIWSLKVWVQGGWKYLVFGSALETETEWIFLSISISRFISISIFPCIIPCPCMQKAKAIQLSYTSGLLSVLQSHIFSYSPSLVGAQLYLFRGKSFPSASKAVSLQLQGSCVTRLFMCISPFHCFCDTRLELQVFRMPGSLHYISSVTISPVKHEIILIFLDYFPLAVWPSTVECRSISPPRDNVPPSHKAAFCLSL